MRANPALEAAGAEARDSLGRIVESSESAALAAVAAEPRRRREIQVNDQEAAPSERRGKTQAALNELLLDGVHDLCCAPSPGLLLPEAPGGTAASEGIGPQPVLPRHPQLLRLVKVLGFRRNRLRASWGGRPVLPGSLVPDVQSEPRAPHPAPRLKGLEQK
jgi:hypothetical protein